MAEQLEERSDGRLKMTLYPNNTLGDTRANIESMQNGSVQIGEGSIAPLAMFTDAYMPFTLPFLFEDWNQVWAFCDSDFVQEINDQVAEELGVRIITMPKGIPNKRYTPEFKKQVVEAVIQEGLSYQEAARIYEVQGHDRIQSWERI